jgi:putative transposase
LTGGEAHDCPLAEPLVETTTPAQELLADKAYDSAELRRVLNGRGTKPVIPNKRNRKQPFKFNKKAYRKRHLIENAFCRLKDFRRIATRYDKLAANFEAAVHLVAAVVWWCL